MFRKKTLTLAVLSALAAICAPAQAQLVVGVCQVNGVDGCNTTEAPTISPGAVMTIRGFAFNLATGDSPDVGGSITLRNEDSLQSYRVPIQRIEARPDIVAPRLTGELTQKEMDALNAGFIAQFFAASLPPGRYSVQSAVVKMKKSGFVTLQLDANTRAIFNIDAASSPFKLRKADGEEIALGMNRRARGPISATNYPPLRDGSYTLIANFPTVAGAEEKTLTFNYKRPVLEVPLSMPLVENFPGIVSNMVLQDPLNNQPINRATIDAIVDEVGSENVKINGSQVTASQTVALAQAQYAGNFQVNLLDDGDAPGSGTTKLFLNTPDAPHLHVIMNRWNPADKIAVTPSKPNNAALVEDITVDARLSGPSKDTCQALATVRPEFSLPQFSGVTCAIRWGALPSGVKHNPYRSNSLTGPLPTEGVHKIPYDPGVVYIDPATRKPAFYKAKTTDKELDLQGMTPNPLLLTFTQDKNLTEYVTSSASQFPGKHFIFSSEQGKIAGVVRVKGEYKNMTTRVTYPDGSTRDFVSSTPDDAITLVFAASTPWATYDVKVESWYTKAPANKTEQVYQFVAVPEGPIIDLDRELASHDMADTILNGSMGIVRGRTVEFDPAKMGKWQVNLVNKDGVSMVGPVPVSDNGTFTFNLGRLTTGSRIIAVKAEMLNADEQVVNKSHLSKQRTLVTEYGSPLESTLATRAQSGAAPFNQNILVNLNDSRYMKNVGNVQWEKQNTAGEWEVVNKSDGTPATGLSLTVAIDEPRTENIRAIVVNRFSGASFTTQPISMQAYNLPSFTVKAPAVVMVGKPVTMTIEEDAGANANYTWRFITSAKTESVGALSGKSLTFTPTENKSYVLEVSARENGAPETAASVTKKSVSLRVVNPLAARATVTGPTFMEVGKPYNFTAKINDVVTGNVEKSYEIKGFWSLPDGTRVDGTSLEFTPKATDTGVSFITYVDGYPEETATTFYAFKTWQYAFPTEWRVKLTPIFLDIPASIRYTIEPANANLRDLNGEPLTYTWSLPANVTRTSGNDVSGTIGIDQVGSYQIAVQVADTRGNVVNVTSDIFSIIPPATVKTEAKLTSKYGDKVYAPSEYYIGVKITELPRGDAFRVNEVIVNEQKIGEFTGSGTVIRFDQAGDYNVMIRTLTKLNNYGESTLNVAVEDAPKPVCTVTPKAGSSTVAYTPTCTVAAGFATGFAWSYMLDGAPQKATSKTLGLSKTWLAENRVSNLELTVTSSIGATTTIQVPVTSF